jgi:thiol-disulfide isomerase/thioredoxin
MNKYIWVLFLYFGTTDLLKSQNIINLKPTQVTAEHIHQKLKTAEKPVIVQFWIPNCSNSAEIIQQYNEVIKNYGQKIDFYFIGITNSDTLFCSKLQGNEYINKNYFMISNIEHQELVKCKQKFCLALCKLMNLKIKDFLTIYVNKSKNKAYTTDDIDITKKMIKKLIK